ncbi:MAG: putative RNA polymerase sigma factor FecI [Xylophilus sp.]|nr:MAG: putative RNA polymerase sigma factor FecI [Xylophilus sp.]
MRAFYEEHHRWLQSLLRKRVGNSEDAADLAQDTFVRLLRAPESLHDIREPQRYLATVARGLAADFFRRRTLEQAYLDYLSIQPEQAAVSAEEQTAVRQTLAALDRALGGLPDKVRRAFLLSHFEELSYPEIAQRLGVSLRTVSNYLTRAMEQCCLELA